MIRGTTPLHTFDVNRDLRNAKVYLTYKQDGRTIVEKSDDLVVTEHRVTAKLSQADTLRFRAGVPVTMQIRYVIDSGDSGASEIMETTVDEILKGGVIRNE